MMNQKKSLDDLLSKILVRDFNVEDQEAARELVLRGLGEHFGWIDPSQNPDLDDIFAAYPASGNRFLVAIFGDEIMAAGGLLFESKGVGRIVRLSVKPEYRGHGVGQEIVLRLVHIAQKDGIQRLNAETNLDWYPAISLYKRCGFAELYSDDESIHLALDIR
jgi:GNAT superfamily N-acetyltransferase